MRNSGRGVGIAGTPKDTKVLIGGGGAKEGKERSGMGNCLRGKTVEGVGEYVEHLSLVAGERAA
jgi:hypothetical protein